MFTSNSRHNRRTGGSLVGRRRGVSRVDGRGMSMSYECCWSKRRWSYLDRLEGAPIPVVPFLLVLSNKKGYGASGILVVTTVDDAPCLVIRSYFSCWRLDPNPLYASGIWRRWNGFHARLKTLYRYQLANDSDGKQPMTVSHASLRMTRVAALTLARSGNESTAGYRFLSTHGKNNRSCQKTTRIRAKHWSIFRMWCSKLPFQVGIVSNH